MLSYLAYGLGVHSQLVLSELVTVDHAEEDVVVRSGSPDPPGDAVEVYGHLASPSSVLLRFPDVGSFLVSSGREIVVEPVREGLDERIIRLFIVGPALGVLLHQRGGVALHASSVAVEGKAVVFLGESEWGKSTSAAAFVRAGFPLVADDVTWVTETAPPTVVPGFPQVKLWPEAASALGWDVDALPLVHPDMDKRAIRADENFSVAPLPLGRVYVLSHGPANAIEPIEPQDAFVELVRHSFAVDLLGPTGMQREHFERCSELAASVPFRRLVVTDELAAIKDLPRVIAGDI